MNIPKSNRRTFLKGTSSVIGWMLLCGGPAFATSPLNRNPASRWRNSLKPSGKPAAGVKVTSEGKPLGVILCEKEASSKVKKAAADLQHWIEIITGARLPINTSSDDRGLIEIHTDGSLGNEGYEIAVVGGRILLSGGMTRGIINAVYALLEEDLGCRFYTNDSIRLPKTGTLVIAPVVRRYDPQLSLRDPFYACAFDPVWSLRNRTNAPNAKVPEEYGGHVDYDGMFVHTAAKILPPKRYFKEHPEYFAQQKNGVRTDAQLCPTEPAVAQIAIDYVRNVLKTDPFANILSVSKNDCQVVCHCPRCEKLREAEGSDMANQLFLVNQVAEAIEVDHPDVLIDTLAYLDTVKVPKTMRPRKNVAIRICNAAAGAWSHPFTPAEQCKIARTAWEWSAVRCAIYIWDYTVNFSHYFAPMPNLDVIAANIRFWIKGGARGVMLQGGYQGPCAQDQLKSWVAAKLMWNPKLDEIELARDFIRGHYEEAAPALEDYQELLEQMKARHAKEMAKPQGGIRYPMDASFITKDFIVKARQIFAHARKLAAGNEVLTRRVERAELPILYVQCVHGPRFVGKDYGLVVDKFRRICEIEKITCLQEGKPDIETKLKSFKRLNQSG